MLQEKASSLNAWEVFRTITKWHEFHKRSRSPFFSRVVLGGAGIQKKDFPFDHRVKYFGNFCDHVAIATAEKEMLGDRAVNFLQQQPDFLLNLMQCAYKEHEICIKKWQKNDARDYSVFDNMLLAEALKEYAEDLQSFGIYVTLPLFIEGYLEEFLKSELQKICLADAALWFGVVTDPIKNGIVLEEEMACLKMVIQEAVSDQDIAEHVKTYSWMANTGFYETYYDETHYRELLKLDKKAAEEKLEHIMNERVTHRSRFEEFLSKISDNHYLTAIVQTANEAVFFRSYRTEIFYGSSRFNQQLLKEVALRLGFSDYKDIVWLYWDEIYSLLKQEEKADTALIVARKKANVFLSDYDGAYYHWEGDEAIKVYELYNKKDEQLNLLSELKGSGAFPGKVCGKVVILHSIKDANKIQGGEILVTHATNVNFVPILRTVSGIITEEGGILSHAAIISRELRIPCVIGTKIATNILKDGDVVELDAENGIIKILK